MKLYHTPDRLSNEQKEALKSKGLLCYECRFWDDGKGEQVESKNVLVNFSGTIIVDEPIKWDDELLIDGFNDCYIYDLDEYIEKNNINIIYSMKEMEALNNG